MSKRIAAVMSLIVFAFCLVEGGIRTGNPFSTTVTRAVIAMFVTLMLGLIIGAMGEKMLDENLKSQEEKLKNSARNSEAPDR
ncbi:MAG TPA: hypothetical protein VL282_16430 [Tepidisphaeraceae bacterium]|jgi:hypothetical protein|nr:hypothetical protein [Tepidisphaeraceae bacterium]